MDLKYSHRYVRIELLDHAISIKIVYSDIALSTHRSTFGYLDAQAENMCKRRADHTNAVNSLTIGMSNVRLNSTQALYFYLLMVGLMCLNLET